MKLYIFISNIEIQTKDQIKEDHLQRGGYKERVEYC